MLFSFFFILVSEPLLYHVEYSRFIFPHLHPNTCIHGYSQSQHHSLFKCQTRQGKLSTVAFPVPSFYREECSTHYQSGIHSGSSLIRCSYAGLSPRSLRLFLLISSASPYLVMCGALWSKSLYHPPELECSNSNTSYTPSRWVPLLCQSTSSL